jgi:predicted nucleotidyltransferase
MQRDHVAAAIRKLLPELRSRFGVRDVWLFGSVARGEDKGQSDIDVMVSFEPDADVTLVTFSHLSTALEEALGRRVDLVEDHARLLPGFRAAVERDRYRVA